MNYTILGMLIPILLAGAPLPESYLFQPSYALREDPQGPAEVLHPATRGPLPVGTDESFLHPVFGHTIVGGAGVHHSGIIFARPDGEWRLIEAGPFNEMVVRVLDPYQHMSNHVARGTKVWVRRRRVPLTPEQSAQLSAFALSHEGKPFAAFSARAQLRQPRSAGEVRCRTPFIGRPHGDRPR